MFKRFEKCLAVILENLTKHIYHTFSQWPNQQSKGVKNMKRSGNSEVDSGYNSNNNANNTDHTDNVNNDMKALWGIKTVSDKIRSKPYSELFLHPVILSNGVRVLLRIPRSSTSVFTTSPAVVKEGGVKYFAMQTIEYKFIPVGSKFSYEVGRMFYTDQSPINSHGCHQTVESFMDMFNLDATIDMREGDRDVNDR